MKNVLIAGLGLIGGSIAKALKKYTDFVVYGYDQVKQVEQMALNDKTIDFILDDITKIDLVIVSMYPIKSIDYLKNIIPQLTPSTLVVDLVGIKTELINDIENLACQHNINFVGGHPMAGLEKGSFERSFAELYHGANMILVPTKASTEQNISDMSSLFKQLGFGYIKVCDKVTHDKLIAHTSQLAHVVSNSYVKTSLPPDYMHFCGGSYNDMTRIACLNEKMWTELFMLNKQHLLKEISILLENITNVKNALENNNADELEQILKDGRICSEIYNSYKKDVVE
ncbi:hypothetical protein AN640_00090 [Candidatus Epulonipiscium fishelsonii]|uniref:Uncharacterized protein n=1 Tax=Candidatus Epulonipiscium fishelsonii TaxID=77094 RepID=A0ACC8XJA5_9FIRM|nr:hypothetical protein AN640_00090 [Epulopiscium sp. SCG-D08WGA-EpuloA1]OON91512.1 MAG: hypothetical protein ATN32_02355 [Epulopiscium sp. AS2M-Bin002]